MLLAHRPTHIVKLRAELFRVELLVDLCIAGLATAKPEQMHGGGRHDGGGSHEDHGGRTAGAHGQGLAMTKKRRTYEPRVFDGRLMLGGVGAASPMSPPPSFRTRNGYPAATLAAAKGRRP
jgi:hypothetical protein